jgi:hypothetical protein
MSARIICTDGTLTQFVKTKKDELPREFLSVKCMREFILFPKKQLQESDSSAPDEDAFHYESANTVLIQYEQYEGYHNP